MEKIDKYIESVYRHLKGDPEEIIVLKKEMKSHLFQTVKELQAEGKSEEESIEIAISRFGEIEKIQRDLTSVFTPKKITKLPVLIIAIVFFLLAIISYNIIYPIVFNQAEISGELNLYVILKPIPFALFSLYILIYFFWGILNVIELRRSNHVFGVAFLLLNVALMLVALKVVVGMYMDNSFCELTTMFLILGIMISTPTYLLLRMGNKCRLKNS